MLEKFLMNLAYSAFMITLFLVVGSAFLFFVISTFNLFDIMPALNLFNGRSWIQWITSIISIIIATAICLSIFGPTNSADTKKMNK